MEPKILIVGKIQSVLDNLAMKLKEYNRDILVSTNSKENIDDLIESHSIDFVVVGTALPDEKRSALVDFIHSIDANMPVHLVERKESKGIETIVSFVNKQVGLFGGKVGGEKSNEESRPTAEPVRIRGKRSISTMFQNYPKIALILKKANIVKKYVFDFSVIFISIVSSFALTEYNRGNIHRKETETALIAVLQDLRHDTLKYDLLVPRLNESVPILLEVMNGGVLPTEVKKIENILYALRAYHGTGVQKYGYHYLYNNIKNPKIKVPNLLQQIGVYHEHSSPEGNFGGFNKDFYEIAFENHKKLFEIFPNYLHPDTTLATQSILDGAEEFLSSPYWAARVSLTYRQIDKYNIPVYMNNKKLAVKIIKMIKREVGFK
jgi:hypothetical protein